MNDSFDFTVSITSSDDTLEGIIIDNSAQHQFKNSEEEFIDLARITFNPLTILGDIEFIANDFPPIKNELNMSIAITFLFDSPYPTEKLFDNLEIDVEHNFQYFSLLTYIKDIIVNDKKITPDQLLRLASYFKINPSYTISNLTKQDSNGLSNYTPLVFGLGNVEDIFTPDFNDHIYTCDCSSISELIFSIFYYLILYNYHFYKCQHCKKYSAIRRAQGTKRYCKRENVLPLSNYKTDNCEDAIKKLLDNIRTKKKKIYNFLYNTQTEEEDMLNEFLQQYHYLNDKVKQDPSAENLLLLNAYVNANSVKKLKKKNRITFAKNLKTTHLN